jgi:Skp family chaperone for outer membrane proteins
MKKIILAPAVALAFTGLVASPVAAAESPSSAQSASEQKAEKQKLEKEKAKEAAKAKAEKEAAEKKAAEKAEADKKAKEKAAADKKAKADAAKKAADKKKAAEDKADKNDDKPKPPKKVDPKPAPAPKDEDKDAKDDDNSEDKINPINASVQVTSGEVTAEELADEGVTVKVTGLEKGDVLTSSGQFNAPTTTAQGTSTTIELSYSGDAEEATGKSLRVAFNIKRQAADGPNSETATETATVTVTEDEDAVDPIDASLKVSPDKITAEDLANKEKGVDVTVSGVKNGDKIKDSLTGETETADADGDHVIHLWSEKEVEEGKVPFTVTIVREGTDSVDVDGTINVVDNTEADPKVKLGTDKITVEEFKKNGLPFSGAGFTPGSTVSVTGEAVSAQAAKAQADEVTADEDGNVEGVVTAPASLEAGKYSLTFTDDKTGEKSDPVEVTVTEDEDAVDPIDASLKVDPKKITAEDLANKDKGVTVTVSGVKKGDKIKDSLTGETETADADGDYKLHLWYEGNPKNLEVGKVPFSVTIEREGTESKTLNGNINVIDDEAEAPAEATLKVSPKTIEAADFANEKKGVTLAVENCEPGQDVHFEVNPKGINVTAYENTVKADDEGNASVNVFGTSSNASAYVGAYTATATCGDDTMKDSFKVTGGANGGGDNGDNGNAGNGSGDDGSQLPRTGADLGGLTTGALLLLVGGAAIAVTGRKNKFGQNPMSF